MKTSTAAVRFMSRCITLGALVALMGCGETSTGSGPTTTGMTMGDQTVTRSLAKKVLGMSAEESAAADQYGIATETLVEEAVLFTAPIAPVTETILAPPSKTTSKVAAESAELIAARTAMAAALVEVNAAKVVVDAVKADPPKLFVSAATLARASDKLSKAADVVAKLTPTDVKIPLIISFAMPKWSTSLDIPVQATVWDDTAVTGWIITNGREGITPPSLTDPRWSSTPITKHTVPVGSIAESLLMWVRDAAGNISQPIMPDIIG